MNRNDLFLELTKDTRWSTIGDLSAKLDNAKFWTDEQMAAGMESYKRDFIRRAMRSMKDANGWPIFASVVVQESDGSKVRVYKNETLFDVEDYRQTVAYHQRIARHHIKMSNGYAKRCGEHTGNQLPLPFVEKGRKAAA